MLFFGVVPWCNSLALLFLLSRALGSLFGISSIPLISLSLRYSHSCLPTPLTSCFSYALIFSSFDFSYPLISSLAMVLFLDVTPLCSPLCWNIDANGLW
ncbi:hypothetical protein F5H01DRAFT_356834 [Linnemannia elongata]|nr:hypothetical protein F5H01DRAFT_356834 [Linnemannia elongata]